MRRAVVVVAALGLAAGMRLAMASVEDRTPGAGAQAMAPFQNDVRNREPARTVEINGLRLQLATGHTAQTPAQVHAWYREQLRGPEYVGEAMSFGNERVGGLAAVGLGAAPPRKELAGRLARFYQTGDLGALGGLRYLYHQPDGRGGTDYLTIWNDQGIDPAHLLPASGDAPGRDPAALPRCPEGRRVLSFAERGQPYRLATYECPGASVTVRSFYEAQLRAGGWHLDEHFARFAADRGRAALHATRGGADVYIDVAATGAGTAVNIVAVER